MIKKYIKNPIAAEIADWLLTFFGAFILYLFVQAFLFRLAYVSGPSMEPTLHHGQRVIVSRITYIISEPTYGDIIAFPYKEDKKQHYVKRIAGLPGDIINMDSNSKIEINGELLVDEFSESPIYISSDISYPFVVPENSYFVLGDNRNNSKDSRTQAVGCVPRDEIVGKISIRVWPLNRIGKIS